MNAQFDLDPDLLELLRAADPLRLPAAANDPHLDADSALRRLNVALEPIRASRPRRRRSAARAAVVVVAVAAIAFAIFNVASTKTGSGVAPAEARVILRHVRDALRWPAHAIYEEESVTTDTRPNGTRHTVEYHEWLSTRPPYNNRLTVIVNGKVLWEQAFVNGRRDIYDPTTSTIYLAPGVTDKNVVGCHQCSSDTPQTNSALSEVADLLNDPHVSIDRNTTVDGKPAIKLVFDRGRFTYWISARTYLPIQIKDSFFPGLTRYPVARLLTGPAASPALLSLQAEHPHATIDHSTAAYHLATQMISKKGAQTGR